MEFTQTQFFAQKHFKLFSQWLRNKMCGKMAKWQNGRFFIKLAQFLRWPKSKLESNYSKNSSELNEIQSDLASHASSARKMPNQVNFINDKNVFFSLSFANLKCMKNFKWLKLTTNRVAAAIFFSNSNLIKWHITHT